MFAIKDILATNFTKLAKIKDPFFFLLFAERRGCHSVLFVFLILFFHMKDQTSNGVNAFQSIMLTRHVGAFVYYGFKLFRFYEPPSLL